MGSIVIYRDLDHAVDHPYDLIVIGGGVYGISVALESVRRGLRTLLLEKKDFGGATSWNSLRILHGGLRYLQSASFERFFESTRERQRWMQDFPTLTAALPCLMPLERLGLRSRAPTQLALALNNWLTRRASLEEPDRGAAPDSGVISVPDARQWLPGTEELCRFGAALWFDGLLLQPQRVLVELLRQATGHGAIALNYCAASQLIVSSEDRVEGVEAFDQITGQPLTFSGRHVVNCAGPWSRDLAEVFHRDVPELFMPSLAINVLIDRPPMSTAALALRAASADSQTFFLLPWQGRILAGTFHHPWDSTGVNTVDLEPPVGLFLNELNRVVPDLELDSSHIARVFWGLLPVQRAGTTALRTRPVIWAHGDHGGPKGLFSISGVKFTTARAVARRTIDRIAGSGRNSPALLPAVTQKPSIVCPGAAQWLDLARQNESEAAALVRRIVHEESVQTLDDLLTRRTDWSNWIDAPQDFESTVSRLAGLSESTME